MRYVYEYDSSLWDNAHQISHSLAQAQDYIYAYFGITNMDLLKPSIRIKQDGKVRRILKFDHGMWRMYRKYKIKKAK